MTPEQLRDAITDNSVGPTDNSYGNCRHTVSFAQHCWKCEMEKYSISQRSPGWFEKQAKEFPVNLSRGIEQLRDELADTRIDSDWHSAGYCPHDTPLYLHCDACAVDRVTAQYRAPFTAEEIRRADRALSKYQRHTVDITGPAPQYVEDDMLAVERGWKRAKLMWVVLGVLVAGFVVWRLVSGGE